MPVFQYVAPWRTNFHFILRYHSLGLSNSLVHLPVKSSIVRLRAYFIVVALSYLDSHWFSNHPYYSLNSYVHLYYLWSISIAKYRHYSNFFGRFISIVKDHRYPKSFILCLVYFYKQKTAALKRRLNPRLWWS